MAKMNEEIPMFLIRLVAAVTCFTLHCLAIHQPYKVEFKSIPSNGIIKTIRETVFPWCYMECHKDESCKSIGMEKYIASRSGDCYLLDMIPSEDKVSNRKLVRPVVITKKEENSASCSRNPPDESITTGKRILLIDAPANLTKNNMIRSLTKMSKEYRIRFDMKMNERSSHLANAIHFTTISSKYGKHGFKCPAVYFKGSKIYIDNSVGSDVSHRYVFESSIVGIWITIDISQIKDKSNKFIYMIKINGEKVHEVINTSPREFLDVDIFAGNPWFEPGKAVIRNLELYGEFIEAFPSLLINLPLKLTENNLITTVSKMGSIYRVRFDMNVKNFSNYWTSVIHFTIGGNYRNFGDRYPAVLNKENYIHIASAVNQYTKYYYERPIVEADKWMNIDISQTKDGAHDFIYTVRINGIKKVSAINKSPREFSNVKVYAGDPFYPVGENTLIRKLQLYDADC